MYNEWESMGEEIRRTIQDVVESGDYTRLNQTISNTINRAMGGFSRTMGGGTWSQGQQAYGSSYQYQEQPRRERYAKTTGTRILGTLLTLGGVGMAAFMALCCLFVLWLSPWFYLTDMIGLCLFAFGFLAVGVAGISMTQRARHFRKYVEVIGEREYCPVKELSDQTGRSRNAVVKDLEKMIRKGWFYEGYLDPQRNCLTVTREARTQYMQLLQQARMKKEEEQRAKEAAQKAREDYSRLSPEVQKIVDEGEEYIRRIHAANDAIPGEEISSKISRMELLLDRIFDRVERNPELAADLHRLMEYYLPTTVKLLDAYEKLDDQPVQGENILSSKREIEQTLDTLNTAFEKLLDSLFQDTAWDLSADISVLNTMLAQEGLTEDGINSGKHKG